MIVILKHPIESFSEKRLTVLNWLKGAYCWDVDGNKYIDYIGSWGPAIVGAADDEVNEVLHAQLEKGTSFGAPCALEVRA